MVTLNIDGARIHLAGRPSTRRAIPVATIDETSTARGAVRQYASGVRRSIVAPGATPQVSLTLVYAHRETANTLLAWVGDVVVYRDRLSRVVYGRLNNVTPTESPAAPDDQVGGMTLSIIPTTETAEIV